MEWQYKLLNDLSFKYGATQIGISAMPLDVSIDLKRAYLKFPLKKFYRPTIENLSDVANQLLWLADPTTFNDPKDSQLGIDENFKIYALNKFIDISSDFSDIEKRTIANSLRRKHTITSPNVWPILQINNRLSSFDAYHRELTKNVDAHIAELKKHKYRIACFVQDFESYEYDTLMWAHYAQNFQGFCVEYDVEKIFDYVFSDYSAFYQKSPSEFIYGFLDKDTIKRLIINGLFPVHYSSKPQSISSGDAYKIATERLNKESMKNIEYNYLKALITKDLVWKYEREWRLIISDDMISSIGHKIPFPFAKRIIPGRAASHELKLLLHDISIKLKLPPISL